MDTYKGKKNDMKANIVWDAGKEMNKDKNNKTWLKNDNGEVSLSMDIDLIDIIYWYYRGKTITIVD